MFNLSRLYMLHQLSVLGTMSAVAEKRKLTRPAVSKQLAQLEQEIGTALFERTGHKVQLTAAARRLVGRASALFELAEEIRAEFSPSTDNVSGEVTIATFASLLTRLLPMTLTRLIKSHPKLDIIFHEMEPASALRATAANQVDLALVDDQVSGEPFADSLELRPLYTDHYGVALAASHPLASRRTLQLSELKRERWAMGQEGAARYTFLLNACHASGFAPHVVSRSVNFAVRLELVRTGYVVAVLPWLALRLVEQDHDFRLIELTPPLKRDIFIALRRGTSHRPAIAAVLQALQWAATTIPTSKTKSGKRRDLEK
jgi:DNA-binding transcriptional LysR family regulator